MMSLYLKALEGEKSQLPPKHALLPELKYNIVCGNSLIGPDIYDQGTLFGDEERERINAFDWFSVAAVSDRRESIPAISDRRESVAAVSSPPTGAAVRDRRYSVGPPTIPDIMRAGGFDCVIGNPPYVRIQHMKEWAPVEVEYYKDHYKAASSGNYDIYVVFVEKGLRVLNRTGKLGFIVPHKFFNSKYGEPLRSLIAEGKHLSHIVHFGDQQVFEGATNYTCLLFLDKSGSKEFDVAKVDDLEAWRNRAKAAQGTLPASSATAAEWNFAVGGGAEILQRLRRMPTKLADVAKKIFQGLVTSADPVYVLDPVGPGRKGLVIVRSRATGREYELESDVVKPLCKGSRDIRRYSATPSKAVLFPYDPEKSGQTKSIVLISPSEFDSRYPRAWRYLAENRNLLRDREKGKMRHEGWYGYIYPKSVSLFSKRKIITPSIAASACFTLDARGELYFVGSGGGGGGGYGIILNDTCAESYEYVLGLLNSRLLDHYLKQISGRFRGGYFAYSRQFIEQLPIRTINFSDPADKARHDRMVELVERMLELHKRRGGLGPPAGARRAPLPAGGDTGATELDREIAATDAAIDNLVYELYGITEEERTIIERNWSGQHANRRAEA
jgi:hypothetical protein